jgi:hypothetical protein
VLLVGCHGATKGEVATEALGPWYPATLRHPLLHSAGEGLKGLPRAIGLALLVPLREAATVAAEVPYAMALVFAFVELLADAVPGTIVRLDEHVITAGPADQVWGTSLLHDAQPPSARPPLGDNRACRRFAALLTSRYLRR